MEHLRDGADVEKGRRQFPLEPLPHPRLLGLVEVHRGG